MALITDPDLLAQGVEVTINTGAKTIALNIAGDLSTDGVTLKCLYSFLKEEWKSDTALIKFPFPMGPITDEQFEFVSGWNLANDASRYLIRTGGWAVISPTTGNPTEMWAGVITLGSLESDDQVYFQQTGGGASSDIELTGPVNQAVKIYTDTDGNGTPDTDSRSYLKLFVREWQQTYAAASLSDIGVTQMAYQVYRFPLASGSDLKVTHLETGIDANADGTADVSPYSGMTITYYATDQNKTIGAGSYPFRVVVDGNGGTAEQIYEFVQWSLRKNGDIDAGAGTVTGKTADALLRFVGDNLITSTGVFIEDFSTSDTNRITFTDYNGVARTYPYVAVLTLNFGDTLRADADAKYWVYFTNDDAGDNAGDDYGTAGAILVQDNSDVDMTGLISGAASVTLTYDYDGNVQRGAASAGDDAPITVVAIGLGTAQFVKATATIQRSNANVASLVAPLERNYLNP